MNNLRQDTTESIRIDKELMDKIRIIAKNNGQTLTGYINVHLSKTVERQWQKFSNEPRKQGSI